MIEVKRFRNGVVTQFDSLVFCSRAINPSDNRRYMNFICVRGGEAQATDGHQASTPQPSSMRISQ